MNNMRNVSLHPTSSLNIVPNTAILNFYVADQELTDLLVYWMKIKQHSKCLKSIYRKSFK